MAQRIQMDSAPHCSWSSSALCWAEETGTRRQERTGWAAASRNQIRAQAGSRPGGWCSMPTELIEEVVVVMAALAEDSQTRPRSGASQGRLWNRPITTTESSGGHRNGTHRGEPQRGTNTAEDSAPAAAMAARSSSTWASCSSWASLSC